MASTEAFDPVFQQHPYLLTVDDTASALSTSVDTGLTEERAVQKQAQYGPNELDVGGGVPWYKILAKQLFNAMNIVSKAFLSFPYTNTVLSLHV